jgi:hypothetical protein
VIGGVTCTQDCTCMDRERPCATAAQEKPDVKWCTCVLG